VTRPVVSVAVVVMLVTVLCVHLQTLRTILPCDLLNFQKHGDELQKQDTGVENLTKGKEGSQVLERMY